LRDDHLGSPSQLATEVRGATDAGGRIAREAPRGKGMWAAFRKEDMVAQSIVLGAIVVGLTTAYGFVRNLFRKAEQKTGVGRWLKRTGLAVAGAVGLLWLWHFLHKTGSGTGPGSGGGSNPDGRAAGDAKPEEGTRGESSAKMAGTDPVAGAKDVPPGTAKPETGQREGPAKPPAAGASGDAKDAAADKQPEAKNALPESDRPERELPVMKDGGVNVAYHRERLPSAKTVRIQILGAGTDPPHPGGEKAWAIRVGYDTDGKPTWAFYSREELLTQLRTLHEQGRLEHVLFYVQGDGFSIPALAATSGSDGRLVDRVTGDLGVPVSLVAIGSVSERSRDTMNGHAKSAMRYEDPASGKPLGVSRPGVRGPDYTEHEPGSSYGAVYLPTEEEYLRSLCPATIELLPGDVRKAPVVKASDVAQPMTMEAFLDRCAVQPKIRAVRLASDPDAPGVPECQRLVTASGRIFVKTPTRPPGGGGTYLFIAREKAAAR